MSEENVEAVCALESCGKTFRKSVHNQRFCNRECTRIYTNARILAAYHEKKNKTMTGRICKKRGCGTVLSRYNDDDTCGPHQLEDYRSKLNKWGWKLDEEGEIRF